MMIMVGNVDTAAAAAVDNDDDYCLQIDGG